MRCNALPLVHAMPDLLTSYVPDLRAVLASTCLGSVSSAWLPSLECAKSNTLGEGLAKIRAAREYDGVSFFALTPEWIFFFFEDVDGSQHYGSF